jgi:hypothetical protein
MKPYTLNGSYEPLTGRAGLVTFGIRHLVATEAGNARSASRPAPALLSMGHISSPSCHLSVWTEGGRADFPRIPNLNPKHKDQVLPISLSPRGVVSRFTIKSRRRFIRELATIKLNEIAYTMALTLPGGDISTIFHEQAMEGFKVLKRRLSNVRRFKKISGFWKRELQERGAIHYHLIIYGLSCELLRKQFQNWIAEQWNSILCADLSEKQTEEHRWWHSRPENMELVRNTAYFVKYVGKSDAEADLTGRWWGKFNQAVLPVSIKDEYPLSDRAAILLHRLARKRQQKRANEAKHRAIAIESGLVDFNGQPLVSQFRLFELKSRLRCFDQKILADADPKITETAVMLHAPSLKGLRWGKASFRGKAQGTGPVVLCDPAAVLFADAALTYVRKSLLLEQALDTSGNPPHSGPRRRRLFKILKSKL